VVVSMIFLIELKDISTCLIWFYRLQCKPFLVLSLNIISKKNTLLQILTK
jgi:hypothetical protein